MKNTTDATDALDFFEQHVLERLKRGAKLEPAVILPLIVGLAPGQEDEPPYQPLAGDHMEREAIRRWDQNRTPEAQALYARRRGYRKLRKLWDEEHSADTRMSLAACVAWAEGTGIDIPWLDAARTAGLILVESNEPIEPRNAKRNAGIRARFKVLSDNGVRNYVKDIKKTVKGADLLSDISIRRIAKNK